MRITNKPTEQIPNHSGSYEIHSFSWNLKVYYRVHKSPLLDCVLSQMNPVHTLTTYVRKSFNIIIPSTPRSHKLSLHFQVLRLKFCMYFLSLLFVLHASLNTSSLSTSYEVPLCTICPGAWYFLSPMFKYSHSLPDF
jgi:hypothetical protein